jgi:hypothetical protein
LQTLRGARVGTTWLRLMKSKATAFPALAF